MGTAHVASLALLTAGVAVIVVSSLGAMAQKGALDRLHYVTPITSLGAPLVGLSLAVADGWGLSTAEILLTVFLLAAAGPVLEAATGRMVAQERGLVPERSPD
ncbi:MAG TPA: monovalent cation/H(+) antiporter subunit G [Acidimicrobiales bacterium]|nr:monovalent cation/H(+) antiporter subunit G [Acidimicrobiales bacterium]